MPELKEKIIKNLLDMGISKNDLKGLKKPELLKLQKDMEAVNKLLDDAELTEDEQLETNINLNLEEMQAEDSDMDMTSPEWSNYVLSELLADDELDHGQPKADGLRRVATKLFGVLNSHTQIESAPSVENAGRATVVVTISYKNPTSPNGVRVVSGSADVYSGNTDRKFAEHAVATAETRAEARALRRALALKTVTAEELQNADVDEAGSSDVRAPESMINGLKVMSARVGVDPVKISSLLGYEKEELSDLTKVEALEISKEIGSYQRKEKDVPALVKA